MKKRLFLITLVGLLLSACSEETVAVKESNCSEYSLECEIKKQYIFVDPIEFNSEAKDAWGAPINSGWYAINMDNPGVLLPIRTYYPENDYRAAYDEIEKGVKNKAYIIDTLYGATVVDLGLRNIQKIAIVYAGKNVFTFSKRNQGGIQGAVFTVVQY